MRELHVVAVSEDGRHVLLGTTRSAKAGTFRVKLDDRLVAAVRGDLRLAEAPTPELSPKEIQARLRAGESAESIARKAGVAITRVERFAGPVAGEMARMIDAAREARLVRRSGPSTVALGAAVDAAVGNAEADWTTRREEDGRWLVTVAWVARNRRRTGSWHYDPHTGELTAADPASASLGHVSDEPPRKRAPKPAAPAPEERPVRPRASKPKAQPDTQRAATKPRQTAKAAAEPAATPRKRAAASAGTRGRRLQVVPDPGRAKPRRKAVADERDGVSSRASVPAWADVLLGTTPADR